MASGVLQSLTAACDFGVEKIIDLAQFGLIQNLPNDSFPSCMSPDVPGTSYSFDSFPPTLRRLLWWCNLRGSRHSHGDEVPSTGWDPGLRRRRRRGRTPATSTRGASRPRSEAYTTQPLSHALSHALSHPNQNASSAKQARTTTD